ncbi:unnamed protein product [Closterium sp. NIES-64]|nr:unnamed protein product [Closterium sp. NIES-64]
MEDDGGAGGGGKESGEWQGSKQGIGGGGGGGGGKEEEGSVSFWILPSEDPWAWAEGAAVDAALGRGGGGGGRGGGLGGAGGGSGMGSLSSYRQQLKHKILSMHKKAFPEAITEREWAMRAAAAWGAVRTSPLIAQFAHFLQSSPLFQQP